VSISLEFRTGRPVASVAEVADWFLNQGEPCEPQGPTTIALLALPVHLILHPHRMEAQIDLTPKVPLHRLVRVMADLAIQLGAETVFHERTMGRSELWLVLAEEQDRMRIQDALDRAEALHCRSEVLTQLWQLLGAMGQGRDLRWDLSSHRIIEFVDTGPLDATEDTVDTVTTQAPGPLRPLQPFEQAHITAWRWLSEAWPNLRMTP